MITPEQKKKIMIMAGIFLAALVAFVLILVLPKMKTPPPPGNEAAVPQTTTTPEGNAPPSTTTPSQTPQGNAPPGNSAGNPPPGGPPPSPGQPPNAMGTTTAGVMSKPAPIVVPPTALPSLTPPIAISTKYDPFSGGPVPPKPKIIKKPDPFLTPFDEKVYAAIMDRSIKSNTANVSEGEIYIAYVPFVHNSSYKAMPYVPVARKEENIETPPGRHAGYVYSEGGKVFAIFEDQTHQPRVVSVGDNLNGYTVKSINYNSITLKDDVREYVLKLQPVDSFQWGANVEVDAESNTPRNSPPRWGNR